MSTESLSLLSELFPDWSQDDLTLCLEESRGDLETAITRISEGHASKFDEVTKKKDKAIKRVEHGNGRGRGRGASAPRGRADFRGRGRGRVTATGTTNGSNRNTETSTTWPQNTSGNSVSATPVWAQDAAVEEKAAPVDSEAVLKAATETRPKADSTGVQDSAAKPRTKVIDKNSKFSWASIAKPAEVIADKAQIGKPFKQNVSQATPAPLTEENLEVVSEAQPDTSMSNHATASLRVEPATGPSSVIAAPGTPTAGPPGLRPGNTGRVSTPLGGRKLQQDQAVVMPEGERDLTSRLGVQFGSLGMNDDSPPEHKTTTAPRKHDVRDLPGEIQARQDGPATTRPEKPYDNFSASYGGYGLPAQAVHPAHPGYPGHAHDAYGSNYQEASRPSPFPGSSDYYSQQQGASQNAFPGISTSHRSESASKQTESTNRYPDSGATPMTSIGSQHGTIPTSGSPVPSQQYGGYSHYQQPNPYAYYGYGYGFPQQQSAYQPMYGQRGYAAPSPYPVPVHHPVGTSQDRFERSTAEYQRQQQTQSSSSYNSGNDFLGSSRNHEQSGNDSDGFKGYSGSSNTQTRDDRKQGNVYGGAHYGTHSPVLSYPQHYDQSQSLGHQQQQAGSGQHGHNQSSGDYSQYGNYGVRGAGHNGQAQQPQQQAQQQYGGWNQGY